MVEYLVKKNIFKKQYEAKHYVSNILKIAPKKNINNKINPRIIMLLENQLHKKIYFVKILGKGKYGVVYSFTDGINTYIIKYSKMTDTITENHVLNEYYVQQYLYLQSVKLKTKHIKRKGLRVPKPLFIIIDHAPKSQGGSISLICSKARTYSLKYGMFSNYLKNKKNIQELDLIIEFILKILPDFCVMKFAHGDFHWGNFGYSINKNTLKFNPLIIDFGFSIIKKCNPILELVQLLRTLQSKYWNKHMINEYNRIYLKNKLEELIQNYLNNTKYNVYNITLYNIQNNIEHVYEMLMYEHHLPLLENQISTINTNNIDKLQKQIHK
jgi:hypothetical protein